MRLTWTLRLPALTVVVPVGPGDTLAPELRLQLCDLPAQTRLRVVCAHASDATRLRAAMAVAQRRPSWEILIAPAGRATQQNFGARERRHRATCGSCTPIRVLQATRCLPWRAFWHGDECALGYFDLRFLDDGPRLVRLNELGAWVRSHWLGLPFGDQGLVLPRAAFERLGGFDVRAALGRRPRPGLARAPRGPARPAAAARLLYTSARKYAERGWWRTTREHLVATCRQAHRFSRVPRTSEGE